VRLDELRREAGDALVLEWRAFLLRPFAEERSLEQFTHYTERWARPASMEPGTTFRTWSGDHAPPSHSMPTAIAGKAVLRTFGADAFERFHLALMRAYFADNRTITERSVVLDVATSVGLDAAALAATLDAETPALEAEVIADHRAALALGIGAVPTVVVDEEYLLQGALTLDQYRKVLARLAS
jgi:predicted DsbA family dithiol-disulfide isomerase